MSLNLYLTPQQTWALNEVRGGVEVEDWQDAVCFASTLTALAASNPELLTIEPSARGPRWFWARATPLAIDLLDQREVTPEEELIEGRNLTHEDRWLLFESDRLDVADVPLGSRLAGMAVDLAQRHPRLLTVQETPRGLEVIITPAGREARHRPRPLHPAQLNVLRSYAWGGTIERPTTGWSLEKIHEQRPDLVRLSPEKSPLTAKATYAGLMALWDAKMLPEHPDVTLLKQEWAALDQLQLTPMAWLGLISKGWDAQTEAPLAGTWVTAHDDKTFRLRLTTLRHLYATETPISWVQRGVNVVLSPLKRGTPGPELAVSLETQWSALKLDSARLAPWHTEARTGFMDKLSVTTDPVARSNIARLIETWNVELSDFGKDLLDTAALPLAAWLWRCEAEDLRHLCSLSVGRPQPAGRWVTWGLLLGYPWARHAGLPWAQPGATP